MKAATKRRLARRSRQQLAHCSPVGVAVSRRLMPSEQLELYISMFDLEHGAPCAERLATLAYTLAVGVSIEANARLGSPDCKQMHAALRTVLAMSEAGNRWDRAQAPVLYAADKKAEALLLAHPIQPKDLADRCEALASRVRAGVATLAEVAGPEIYAVAAAEGKKMHLNHVPEKVTHFHLFGGSGSGAAGFKDADPSIGAIKGKMVLLGGIDVDRRACADFLMLNGVPQACVDLFSLQQYLAWHGHMPPEGWREATADTVRAAAQWQFPDIVFLSAPCKGFSGLQSPTRAATPKYQALNELTLRGVWLMLEAFADDLPGLIVFENVPRIATRGRHLLDQIVGMLQHYGYATAETTHDCGELGDGLGQSRRRFLLVARLVRKVPPFLYEPPKRALRSVGEVLGYMPLPGDPVGGPMHRVPALQWKTWVRLAFVEAGSDWRSLNKLAVEDGNLRDFLMVPECYPGVMGVKEWGEPSGTVTGKSRPTNGDFSVADPRFAPSAAWKDGQALGVRSWGEPTGTVAGQQGPLQGAYSVADPRHGGPDKHSNEYRIVAWDRTARAVTSAHGSGQAVADPRAGDDPAQLHGKWHVTPWADATRAVIAGSTSGEGAVAVADPRPNIKRVKGDHYLTGGHYGVVHYSDPAGAVSASACHDNGPWSVADPRPAGGATGQAAAPAMPSANDKLVARIRSLDGTWHRPFTTLELAALQSFIDPEEWFAAGGPADQGERFVLDGPSDQRWREAIGNAVPRKSAKAIGTVMGQTILLAKNGETFVLGSTPIWVRPMVAALAVAREGGTA